MSLDLENRIRNWMLTHYISTVDQGVSFLARLSEQEYCQLVNGMPSSIGSHTRHILDHFISLQTSLDTGIVDYEVRHRGSLLETSLIEALKQFEEIRCWISSLDAMTMTKIVRVNADIGINETHIIQVNSTLSRELMFACSHAIHHYSTLKTLYQLMGGVTSAEFGLAPSTASFNRNQCAH